MSDTPKTDAEAGYYDDSGCWHHRTNGENVDADFARTLERELTAAKAEVEALRALIRLDDVEWRDKHIRPCGGESFQNWLVHVYLPVPLSENDKSPEAALERALAKEKA
jgi:hypothetical protein